MKCHTYGCGSEAAVTLGVTDLVTGVRVEPNTYHAALCYRCAVVEFARFDMHRRANEERAVLEQRAIDQAILDDMYSVAEEAWGV